MATTIASQGHHQVSAIPHQQIQTHHHNGQNPNADQRIERHHPPGEVPEAKPERLEGLDQSKSHDDPDQSAETDGSGVPRPTPSPQHAITP
jgi:hypothetical protein